MIAVLLVVFAAGPSSLWEDVLHPNRMKCRDLDEEGRHLQARNATVEAHKTFAEATRLCPDEPEPFALLGDALARAGEFPTALPALERARVLYGDEGGDAELADNLGLTRAIGGDLDGSLIEYRRALSLGGLGATENWRLYFNLGDTLMALGRLGESIDAYRRAVRASPLKPILHLALAVAYDRDQELVNSQRELGIALSQDPQLNSVRSDEFIFVPAADQHYYLALGYFARGLKSRARWELRQFLHELPDGPYSARARERLSQAEAASPPLPLRRVLDAQITELEPCILRGWRGPLMLQRAAGHLQIVGHGEACLERWLDRVAPLLPSEDFLIDLQVTP